MVSEQYLQIFHEVSAQSQFIHDGDLGLHMNLRDSKGNSLTQEELLASIAGTSSNNPGIDTYQGTEVLIKPLVITQYQRMLNDNQSLVDEARNFAVLARIGDVLRQYYSGYGLFSIKEGVSGICAIIESFSGSKNIKLSLRYPPENLVQYTTGGDIQTGLESYDISVPELFGIYAFCEHACNAGAGVVDIKVEKDRIICFHDGQNTGLPKTIVLGQLAVVPQLMQDLLTLGIDTDFGAKLISSGDNPNVIPGSYVYSADQDNGLRVVSTREAERLFNKRNLPVGFRAVPKFGNYFEMK